MLASSLSAINHADDKHNLKPFMYPLQSIAPTKDLERRRKSGPGEHVYTEKALHLQHLANCEMMTEVGVFSDGNEYMICYQPFFSPSCQPFFSLRSVVLTKPRSMEYRYSAARIRRHMRLSMHSHDELNARKL